MRPNFLNFSIESFKTVSGKNFCLRHPHGEIRQIFLANFDKVAFIKIKVCRCDVVTGASRVFKDEFKM